MKDRPILFSAPMVRAVLAGTKTQTRRVLKQATGPSLSVGYEDGMAELSWLHGDGPGHPVHETVKRVRCPYGVAGDRLWGREAYSGPHRLTGTPPREWDMNTPIWYWADGNPTEGDWTKPKPGMHMPLWASRIELEVVSVRVERLNDISEADARAEGLQWDKHVGWGTWNVDGSMRCGGSHDPVDAYRCLWVNINGNGSWDANPWVWAVEFRRHV